LLEEFFNKHLVYTGVRKMSKTLGIVLAVIGALVLAAFIFGTGFFLGRTNLIPSGFSTDSFSGPAFNNPRTPQTSCYNMMDGFDRWGSFDNDNNANVTPLTIDQAKQAVEGYLENANNADLELGEIMIFSNHAYARIVEKSTGIGAMELLVDPTDLLVFPEYGPNMMWNLKYGMMSIDGMMCGYRSVGNRWMMGNRGMMGGYYNNSVDVSSDMTITPERALEIAQQYLDQEYPGYKTADDAEPFYGYYTMDIVKDGEPTGMLSVNGFSGQVFLHTWNGDFVEMWE
jgi:hypothetical protein